MAAWRSDRGASRCFRDWLAARGGAGDQEGDRAIAQVRSFIEAHGSSRFERLDGAGQGQPIVRDRVGFCGAGPDGELRWYVLKQQWKTEVCRGLDHKAAARTLAASGMLQTEPSQDHFMFRVKIPALAKGDAKAKDGRQRVYALTPALFDGGDHEF